jgi:hypothetical protein
MNFFTKLFVKGSAASTLNILGGIVATGFLTISTLAFTGVIQIFDGQVTVNFLNYDDEVLDTVQVNRGEDAVYRGETPVKPSNSNQTIFVFDGWSASLTDVRSDLDVKALFTSHVNAFQAQFLVENQEIHKVVVPFGMPLLYQGPNPRYSTDSRFNYEFIGWDITADGVVDPLPVSMNANVVARAIFVARLNSFLVRFKNHNSQILDQQTVFYGDEATYNGRTPFKIPEGGKHFVFSKWFPSTEFVTGSIDVIAEFVDGAGVPFIGENQQLQIGDTQLFGDNQFPIDFEDLMSLLPYVGQDGNWWVGPFNLELLAEFASENSIYPFINELGNWSIGNLDTGIPFDVDLSGVDLSSIGLSGVDLSDIDLSDIDLSGIDFSDIDFSGAGLPTMGENGNWFIGDIDTDIPAIIPSISENETWMIGDFDTNISASDVSIAELGTPFVAPNGNWWIGPNDIGIPAIGFGDLELDLADFQNIPYVGPNENWWVGIVDTGIAVDESMEVYPYIGDNNHWWIGEVDTYLSGHGMQGDTPYPYIGSNNNWYFGITDTGIPAFDGAGDLSSLSINLNGNWASGLVDIGIPAIIISVSMNGNWTINDFDIGISFYETSIVPPYIGSNGNYFIGLTDTGISAYGEVVEPEIPVEDEDDNPDIPGDGEDGGSEQPDEEEPPYVEQILDSGEYSFGYDFSFGGGTGGSGSGGSSGGGTGGSGSGPSQSGICPSDMTVTPLDLEILDIEKVYDGKTIANTSAVLRYDESILQPGEKIVVTFDDMGPQSNPKAMPNDIGQYELRGKLSIVDAEGNILKCVYQPNITFVGDLIITPRSFAINTETVQKTFDGSPLTNSVQTITGQGLAEGHTLVIVFSGTQTEVGSSVNFLDWSKLKVLDENQQDVTKNYSITYNYGMLIVTFAA